MAESGAAVHEKSSTYDFFIYRTLAGITGKTRIVAAVAVLVALWGLKGGPPRELVDDVA